MSTKLLIADSDLDFAESTAVFLKEKRYEVDIAYNGKEAQLMAYKNKYYAVVLDFSTKNNPGIQVLRYLKQNHPSLKIIMTLKQANTLSEFGLAEEDMMKLGASSIITKPFENEKLLEEIEGPGKIQSWLKVQKNATNKGEESVELSDDKFSRIKIDEIYSSNVTVFDLYIKIKSGKYIKILHRGDSFDQKRLDKYRNEKKVQYLFFLNEDRITFINVSNHILDKFIQSNKLNTREKTAMVENIAEKYVEEVYTTGLKPQLVEEGKKLCDNMYNFIQKDDNLYKLFRSFEDFNPHAFAHQFLVSFFAGSVCGLLEWPTKNTIDTVVLGSLLHDIGKLELDEKIAKKFSYELEDDAELEEYQKHPKLGVQILENFSSITEPVKQIVHQHHEIIDGTGYPQGIGNMKIYPLAKIVGNINLFVDIMYEHKKNPLNTLKHLTCDKFLLQKFDSVILKALAKSFIKPDKRLKI